MRLNPISKLISLCRGTDYRLNSFLAEFSRAASACNSPECVYDALRATLSKSLTFEQMAIRIGDLSAGTVIDTFEYGVDHTNWNPRVPRPLAGTVTEMVMEARKAMIFPDTRDPETIKQFPIFKLYQQELPSLLAVPLMYHGTPAGSIQIRSVKVNAFSAWQAQALQMASGYITPTIMNSIHLNELEREVSERTVLAEIGRAASSSIDFETAWDQIAKGVQELLPCDRLVVALVNEDRESITDRYIFGVRIPEWDKQPRKRLASVGAGAVMARREAMVVPADEIDEMYKVPGLRSAMFAPLSAGERIIGVMSVRSKRENAYGPHELELFERVALQIVGSLSAAELYSNAIRLSDERNARVQLELANRKMAEVNAAKSRFISTISHELRTPLTSILAFTGIIRGNKAKSLSERDLKHLEVIHRNGQRLKEMIDDLLDLSSMESDKLSVLGSEFSLRELIDSLVTSMRPIANAKRQRLVTKFSGDDVQLETDRERIEQVLSNLVSNASKYSSDDTEIMLDVSAGSETVSIAVVDSGIGIDPMDIPSLFDEFGRLSNNENLANKKPGLGLAISRKLARTLGGDITVVSKRGEGSVFTLTLPVRMSQAA